MVTYAEDNPYPSVLFAEHVDPSNPAAGHQRLFVDTDHILKLIDSAGTVTTYSGAAGLTDPMTSRGDIIIRNSSNVTARLAKGSAGTYLGSDGTDVAYAAVTDAQLSTSDITTNNASTTKHGFAPKYPNDATKYLDGSGAYTVPAGGSSAGVVLLEQHTASSSATLDFTTGITSTYDDYMFELVNVLPASNAVDMWLRVSTNGGSTFDATAGAYNTLAFRWTSGASAAAGGTSTNMQVDGGGGADPVSSTAANGGVNGTYYMYGAANTAMGTVFKGEVTNGSTNGFRGAVVAGTWTTTTAVNAVRFLFSSGNIASGTIRLYGVAK